MLGHIPGYAGVLWHHDLDFVSDRQDSIELMLVKQGLQQAVKDGCDSVEAGNQRGLEAANTSIDTLSDQYYKLARRVFVRPDCGMVIIHWQDKPSAIPKAGASQP